MRLICVLRLRRLRRRNIRTIRTRDLGSRIYLFNLRHLLECLSPSPTRTIVSSSRLRVGMAGGILLRFDPSTVEGQERDTQHMRRELLSPGSAFC